MKKFILALSLAVVVLSSCSKEENSGALETQRVDYVLNTKYYYQIHDTTWWNFDDPAMADLIEPRDYLIEYWIMKDTVVQGIECQIHRTTKFDNRGDSWTQELIVNSTSAQTVIGKNSLEEPNWVMLDFPETIYRYNFTLFGEWQITLSPKTRKRAVREEEISTPAGLFKTAVLRYIPDPDNVREGEDGIAEEWVSSQGLVQITASFRTRSEFYGFAAGAVTTKNSKVLQEILNP